MFCEYINECLAHSRTAISSLCAGYVITKNKMKRVCLVLLAAFAAMAINIVSCEAENSDLSSIW